MRDKPARIEIEAGNGLELNIPSCVRELEARTLKKGAPGLSEVIPQYIVRCSIYLTDLRHMSPSSTRASSAQPSALACSDRANEGEPRIVNLKIYIK